MGWASWAVGHSIDDSHDVRRQLTVRDQRREERACRVPGIVSDRAAFAARDSGASLGKHGRSRQLGRCGHGSGGGLSGDGGRSGGARRGDEGVRGEAAQTHSARALALTAPVHVHQLSRRVGKAGGGSHENSPHISDFFLRGSPRESLSPRLVRWCRQQGATTARI